MSPDDAKVLRQIHDGNRTGGMRGAGGSPPYARRVIAALRSDDGARVLALLGANVLIVAAYAVGLILALAVVALLAMAAAWVVARPQRGVLVLAALVPYNGLLLIVSLPKQAAGWKEALVLLVLIASLLAPRAEPRRPLPGWAPAIGGLLGLGLASGVAVGGLQAVVGLKVAFFYVALVVAMFRCPLTASDRDRLVTVLIVNGVVTAMVGIAQQVVGAGTLASLGYEYNTTIRTTGGFLRSFSTFNQPFGFGFFLALVMIVAIPHVLAEPRRLRSRVFLACLPLLVVALGFTFVRGAWVSLAVGVTYLGLTRYRVLLLVLPIAAVALLFLPSDVASSAFSARSSEQRVEGWSENLAQIVSHPAGVGVGASGAASEKVAVLSGETGYYQPDNHYFKMLYELGPLGLWLFVLLLAACFFSGRRIERHAAGTNRAMAGGVTAMVLASAAACLVATYFEIFPMDVYFWMLVGVVSTMDAQSAPEPSVDRRGAIEHTAAA